MIVLRRALVLLILVVPACLIVARLVRPTDSHAKVIIPRSEMRPRHANMDTSGYTAVTEIMKPWRGDATLREIARHWEGVGHRGTAMMDASLERLGESRKDEVLLTITKSAFHLYDGEAEASYQTLTQLREKVERDPRAARLWLSSLIFLQGVSAMRRGENDNCIACRGESSCIVPISAAAVHTNPLGSRLAVKHFKEYLHLFPDDVAVRWLLDVANMTLGETPDESDPRFRRAIDRFFHSEFDIGAFRDKSHEAGLDRMNQSGGAIMDDFDGDGLLDVVVTATDPTEPMAYYRNSGDGTFEDRSGPAGITNQLGGLVCYQADYDNDGRLDIFIPRGAWLNYPIRPTLLRNNGAGGFTDVTREAHLLDPGNSNGAAWGDYDNDGWLDLFVATEHQSNHLYRNRRDGTFEDVTVKAGLDGPPARWAKGCTWIDYDNDGFQDLFVNNLEDTGRLYHNEQDGRFTEVTLEMGIDGPRYGFACWAWDYDNDGWLDIFAASAERDLTSVVKSMMGEPHRLATGKLFHNLHGEGFEDLAKPAGVAGAYAPMGCNFADFDNDGWLDFYLGTGEPSLATLVPNRMFKNVGGTRFADITGSSRTGHLQKGHAVACGDWDRDGDVDLFIQMGGAVNGDKYHNILFQNPGQGNRWLTVKLIGTKTNRSAIGARIKVVTDEPQPRSIHRLVSSGSSFGANALQQTVGLAGATRVATLEIYWPASHTTQVFRGVAADQAISITEFDPTYRRLEWKPLPQPH
jgi:FG-GAP-like repeat/ASPIC and UnbV